MNHISAESRLAALSALVRSQTPIPTRAAVADEIDAIRADLCASGQQVRALQEAADRDADRCAERIAAGPHACNVDAAKAACQQHLNDTLAPWLAALTPAPQAEGQDTGRNRVLEAALRAAVEDLDAWVSHRDDLTRSGYDVDYTAMVSARCKAALLTLKGGDHG